MKFSLPSEPPLSLTPMEDTRVLSKSLLFVVLYSYNCHLCLFLCTFLVNCKGVSGLSPFAEPSKLLPSESILAKQTQTSFFPFTNPICFSPLPLFPYSTSCRYKFHNLSTGESSWDYPLLSVLSPGTYTDQLYATLYKFISTSLILQT